MEKSLLQRLIEQTQHFGSIALRGSLGGAFVTVASGVGLPDSGLELFGAFLVTILIALVSLPFVAIGLAIFGLPAMALLSRNPHQLWVGVLAILWGGGAGKIMFFGVDQALRLKGWFLVSEPGIVFGVPTALAAWLTMRGKQVQS